MKISHKLPQFENSPALFITSGEYEAEFYLALDGTLERKVKIKMPPREEAKEKQAFVGVKSGRFGLAAVSHRGAYIEDLKRKFQKKVHGVIHDLLAQYKMKEIYLFSPRYSAKRIMDGLDKSERKKVRMEFFDEYIKVSPLKMIEIFWKTEQEAVKPKVTLKDEEKKILKKPKIR